MTSQWYNSQDSGYAFVVLSAAILCQMLIYGITWTVGVFFAIFVDVFPDGSAEIATIASLNTAFCYGAGIASSYFTNKFGCRPVAIIGGMIGSLGLVFSVFANNIYVLFVTYGVITGVGLGVAYLPSIAIVGSYFTKWRPLALAITSCGVGLGQFTHPPLIRYFLNEYGWRGSLLLSGGVTLHVCLCGVLFKPFHKQNTQDNISVKTASHEHLNGDTGSSVKLPPPGKLLLSKTHSQHHYCSNPLLERVKDQGVHSPLSKSVSQNLHGSHSGIARLKERRAVHLSLASLASEFTTDGPSHGRGEKDQESHFNFVVFKKPYYILLLLNNLGVSFAISIVFVHFAEYAYYFDIDKDSSAMLYTIMGLANFIARICFGCLSQLNLTENAIIYSLSLGTSGIISILCTLHSSYAYFVAYSVFYGFFTATFGCLQPSIIIDILDVKYLTSAYGYILISESIGALFGPPAAGWLYDYTSDYKYSLYLSGMVNVAANVLLLIPYLLKQATRNRISKKCKQSTQITTNVTSDLT